MVPAGIGILYFAVFMTWSGVVYETCTQGATENIVFGAVITAPLYVAGLCLSVFGRPGVRAWYWSVPLWPIAVLIAYGAATLFVHTNIHGDALCNWRTGYDDYDPAGETDPLIPWLAPFYFASAGVVAAAATAIFIRSRRLSRSTG